MEKFQQTTFSGPITLAEVKYALSVKRSPLGITRRATISDMMPSRNIYEDYEELNIWKMMDFRNFNEDNSDTCIFDQYLSLPPFIPLADTNNMSAYSMYIKQVSQIFQVSAMRNEDDLYLENFGAASNADLSSTDSENPDKSTKNVEDKTQTQRQSKTTFMLQSKLNL